MALNTIKQIGNPLDKRPLIPMKPQETSGILNPQEQKQLWPWLWQSMLLYSMLEVPSFHDLIQSGHISNWSTSGPWHKKSFQFTRLQIYETISFVDIAAFLPHQKLSGFFRYSGFPRKLVKWSVLVNAYEKSYDSKQHYWRLMWALWPHSGQLVFT